MAAPCPVAQPTLLGRHSADASTGLNLPSLLNSNCRSAATADRCAACAYHARCPPGPEAHGKALAGPSRSVRSIDSACAPHACRDSHPIAHSARSLGLAGTWRRRLLPTSARAEGCEKNGKRSASRGRVRPGARTAPKPHMPAHGGPTEPASRSDLECRPRRPLACGRCWGPRRCGSSAEEACRGLSPPWRRADRRAATAGTHARRVARRPRRRDAGGATGDHGAWAGGPAAPAARPAAGRLPGAPRRPWWRRSGAVLFSPRFGMILWTVGVPPAPACRVEASFRVCMGEGSPKEVAGH